MEPLERKLITEKVDDGYELTIEYSAGPDPIFDIVWPVHLKHTPDEIDDYISSMKPSEAMARSLRRWCYAGYSLNENGFFVGREKGSELNYLDAYDQSRQSAYIGLSPLDYYLISTRKRPTPASLRQTIPAILDYLAASKANLGEENLLWEWAYKGMSIYDNPDGEDMDYISWLRYINSEMEGPYDRQYEPCPDDDELPF